MFKLTIIETAAEQADIIAFLVAHDEFKNLDYHFRESGVRFLWGIKVIMNYQIIIPARGGSKRFPGKNIALLDNKPLIQHTIEYALINGYQNQIWVNTDDNLIADISKKEGVYITIRPDELGGDFVPTIDVLKHQLAFFQRKQHSL